MAGYKASRNLDFQLNVNNLFDKKYYDGIGANSMVYGEPSNINFNMKYQF
ncbi:TonB-dependent receptor [Aliarcobacter thereius]|uniref:TonB-dependent receptor n=2 Tax=Aliarcobacter thereius TaxID=544718 RepID=A0A5R9H9Y8_9BACT|nr:TonB-dependent receptor [Aliarcobacter thereius]OCL94140.1 Ferric-pseudobactin 358 receptor precursor [Aliarcobacter thereius]OCL95541.1 Ferric-pseudobactin 358 receptor precursor [Aliarcobacter thereius LMG 24486]TLS72938.1 TonB-dependent receptor [Aliarcobacter thereius]TLS91534.1 TonB-dependent receptor [Aliarcobacter thereius]TLT08350.1 TonB-dependent receptor [Aliarcobacter thereius]